MSSPVILIVDDESAIRFCLVEKLSSDFQIIEAVSVAQAKARLVSSHIDIVICDYNMDDGNGLEVLKFMQENDLNLPFFLYTGELSLDLSAITFPKFQYFAKPEFKKLFEAVMKLRIYSERISS